MIPQWDTLKKMVDPSMIGEISQSVHTSRYFAILKEDEQGSITPNIHLSGISPDSLLLKVDDEKSHPYFLNNLFHLHARCDYLLFTRINAKTFIVFFELKSNVVKEGKVSDKFKASKALLEYLSSMVQQFFNAPTSDEVEIRYILIYVPDKPLKSLKKRAQPNHSHPTDFFHYPTEFNKTRMKPTKPHCVEFSTMIAV